MNKNYDLRGSLIKNINSSSYKSHITKILYENEDLEYITMEINKLKDDIQVNLNQIDNLKNFENKEQLKYLNNIDYIKNQINNVKTNTTNDKKLN